jgi:methyltransferase (TIGR00027 family)
MITDMTPVGATSRWIAAARALETECDAPLFVDPYARALAGDDGFAFLAEMRRAAGPGAGAHGATEGPDLYLSLRTRFLDDGLMSAVRDQGVTQLVLLAAGMDTRAFRLPWPDRVVVYELDREDVFGVKEPVLESLGAKATCDRRVIQVDLASDWVPRLIDAGFASHRPAAFLVEGLLMYLEPEAAEGVIRGISSIAVDGSWLGLDTVNTEMLNSPFTAPYMKRLTELGATWHFGLSDPEIFFARHGWHATVVMPGEPAANFGRWTFPTIPRVVPGIPRTFYVSAAKGAAAGKLPAPVSTASAEHYTWGQACDGWHLVKTDGVSVIQERMPPATSEERHRHARARQFFYVLTGVLTLEMEGVTHTLAAGSGIEVPPGAAHTASNQGPAETQFLLVSQPPAHGDREAAS